LALPKNNKSFIDAMKSCSIGVAEAGGGLGVDIVANGSLAADFPPSVGAALITTMSMPEKISRIEVSVKRPILLFTATPLKV